MMMLPPDWNEFIGLSSSNRVRYLIVGAHALAANGRPRATQDLDILVEPPPEVSFEEAWRGRISARLEGHEVGFLGREQFIANKRASGRPKDIADIALLEEIAE